MQEGHLVLMENNMLPANNVHKITPDRTPPGQNRTRSTPSSQRQGGNEKSRETRFEDVRSEEGNGAGQEFMNFMDSINYRETVQAVLINRNDEQ